MRRARLSLLVASAAAVFIAAVGWLVARGGAEVAPGRRLYAEHCAGCHGANLEGQPDWQTRRPDGRLPAPPHDATGHTWHHADADLLVIVRDGMGALVPGYQSDMPAFGAALTDAEILAVLTFIKSTWPGRERAYQAAQTRAGP